jgi:uncharacterized protein
MKRYVLINAIGSENHINRFFTKCAVLLIAAYQALLSPLFGGQCKYHPTCSHYSRAAFEKYGFPRGMGKTIWRLLRCNPFSKGGIDFP